MRIVVLGGHGNFGARICRALAPDPETEVLAAGRRVRSDTPGSKIRGIKVDLASPGFPLALKDLAPGTVIHCAGPFQGQDYRVASAAIAAGAHYIDLELFPSRYPGVRTVEFRAALDFEREFARWRISTVVEESEA